MSTTAAVGPRRLVRGPTAAVVGPDMFCVSIHHYMVYFLLYSDVLMILLYSPIHSVKRQEQANGPTSGTVPVSRDQLLMWSYSYKYFNGQQQIELFSSTIQFVSTCKQCSLI